MRVFFCFFGFVLVLWSASSASAQPAGTQPVGTQPAGPQPARRGDRALFGGGVGKAEQVLSVSSTLGASYFQYLTATPATGGEPLSPDSWLGYGSASVGYQLGLKYLNVNASAGEFSRYYPAPRKQWISQPALMVDASSGRSWHLSPRTTLTASGSVGLYPAFNALSASSPTTGAGPDFDPGLFLPPDVTALKGHWLTAGGGVSFSQALSSRVSVEGGYGYSSNWSFGRPDDVNVMTHSVRVNVRVQVTRHLSLWGGYDFTDSRNTSPGSPHVRLSSGNAGVDYSRGGALVFRLTRRTTLALNGGLGAGADIRLQQHIFFVGSANLTHEMGRTWSTSLRYDRNLGYSSFFVEPVLSDTVRATLRGLITSRVLFSAEAGYTRGSVGFINAGHGFVGGFGSAQLQTGLTRYIALGTGYSYYRRSYESQVVLPSDLLRVSASQSVHVYVSAWAPLLQRTRRSNATR